MLNGFITLAKHTTNFPLPKVRVNIKRIGKAFKFFPIIGFLIGIILAITSFGVSFISKDPYIVSLIVLLAEVILTKNTHIEGFSATFDSIYRHKTKSRMLESMRVYGRGSNGIISIIFLIAFKLLLLSKCVFNLRMVILFPILGRYATVVHAAFGNSAEEVGPWSLVINQTRKVDFMISSVLTLILAIALTKTMGLVLFCITFLVSLLFLALIQKKIKGVTEETLNAAIEIIEVVVILASLIYSVIV